MLQRTLLVLWHIVPIILSFVRDFQRYIFWGSGRTLTDDQHRQRARKLTRTLGYLGPTFIKLAQVLSARADVFPPIYIKELSTLQDKVAPNPTEMIKQVITTELRQPVEAIFEEFAEQSLAAASLGQVHRARYQGDDVVVKVLRPGVPELIAIDMRILQLVLQVLQVFIRDSPILRSFMTAFKEFRRVIQQEMDFEREARNVKIFQRNLAHIAFVLIPKVYDALTTKKVIVLEYLEGVKINEVERIEQMGVDITLILQRLAKVYIHQVMIDGILHADPHPGNILIDQAGHIIILDFGMVVRIEESFKHHLIKAGIAVAHKDVEGIVNALYELGIVEPGTNKAALREIAELMLEIQEQGKLSQQKVQQMITTFMEAFYEFPFTLPAELVYLGRAISLIEGIGFIHDPWFDILTIGRPVIKAMAKEALHEEFEGDTLETLQKWIMRSYYTVTALEDVILKTDREQLRVRLHPTDIQSLQVMIGGAVRRILVGMFAALLGLTSAVIYLRNGNTAILSTGILFASGCLLVLLLLPHKKPETAHQRSIRKQMKMITTEDGEIFKSLVMSQMRPEEREKAEAERKNKEQGAK